MALSGSFSGSQRSGNEKVRVDWSARQNVANNTSTVTCKMYFINQYAISIGSRSHTITINGATHTLTSGNINTIGEHYIGSVSQTITHNADGSKSIPLSFVFKLQATLSERYYESISASTTVSLNTIPRASQPTLSASSTEIGKSVTINTNRASSSFTHTLTYAFGSASGTIATGVGASTSWTLPTSLLNQIPSATSRTGTITCQTYNGSTLIGTKTVSFTATVASTVVPSISSILFSDPTGYISTYGGYVQNKSKVKIAVTASGINGSTIKSYKIVANGTTYTSNGCTTDVLSTSGTNTISVTVTDSRGRTKTSTSTINVIAYKSPSITSFIGVRCQKDGTEDEEGAYLKAVMVGTITSLSDKNGNTCTFAYKKKTDSSYTNVIYSAYSLNQTEIVEADIDSSYDLKLTLTDNFGSTIAESEVSSSFTLMDFRGTGKGIGIGKVSESDVLEVALETRFYEDLRSDGDVIAGLGTANQASLLDANTKIQNGRLRINDHFSGITKSIPAKTWSSTIGTIKATTNGEAILYAEGTFPGITGRKIVEIRKNGNRIARQESSYTGTGDNNAISVCTISTIAPGDKFTAHLYNGISAAKNITNCIFRMIQIGLISQ